MLRRQAIGPALLGICLSELGCNTIATDHATKPPVGSGASSSSPTIAAPSTSAAQPPTVGGPGINAPEKMKAEPSDAEKRYLFPRAAPPGCTEATAYVSLQENGRAMNMDVVAQVLSEFPEFVQVSGEVPDQPFEVAFFDSGARPAQPSATVQVRLTCGDVETCVRLGHLLQFVAKAGRGGVCVDPKTLVANEEWKVIPPASQQPRGGAACARTRICEAAQLDGRTWKCSSYLPSDIERCAALRDCKAVAECKTGLFANDARPGGPSTRPDDTLDPW